MPARTLGHPGGAGMQAQPKSHTDLADLPVRASPGHHPHCAVSLPQLTQPHQPREQLLWHLPGHRAVLGRKESPAPTYAGTRWRCRRWRASRGTGCSQGSSDRRSHHRCCAGSHTAACRDGQRQGWGDDWEVWDGELLCDPAVHRCG